MKFKGKEAINMKRTLILLTVLAVAVTVGTAYADEMGSKMSAGEYNGITAFGPVPAPSHEVGPGLTLGNGITAFEVPQIEYAIEGEGAAAGGFRETETSSKVWENGITFFGASPSYDTGSDLKTK